MGVFPHETSGFAHKKLLQLQQLMGCHRYSLLFFFFPFMAVVLHGATHSSFTGHRRISDSRVPEQAVFKLAPPQL